MIFIRGDVSEGSENDTLLKTIIGPDWKILTGADQPIHSPGASPGYKHDEYWPTVIARAEERKRKKEEIQKEYGISTEVDDSNQVNDETTEISSLPQNDTEEILQPTPTTTSTNEESS